MLEDAIVRNRSFSILVDFVILNMDINFKMVIIFGHMLLHTTRIIINVKCGIIILRLATTSMNATPSWWPTSLLFMMNVHSWM